MAPVISISRAGEDETIEVGQFYRDSNIYCRVKGHGSYGLNVEQMEVAEDGSDEHYAYDDEEEVDDTGLLIILGILLPMLMIPVIVVIIVVVIIIRSTKKEPDSEKEKSQTGRDPGMASRGKRKAGGDRYRF